MNRHSWKAAVTGGDMRQVYVAEALGEKGFSVMVYGLPKDPEQEQVKKASSLKDALENADLVIAPVPFRKEGRIQGQDFYIDLTEENFLKYLKKGSLFCAGGIPESFHKKVGERGIRCFDFLEDSFTAMENTIATAEGAVAQAIIRSPENLRGSLCLVIGYGRCGRTLAGYLQKYVLPDNGLGEGQGKSCPGKSCRTSGAGGERTSPCPVFGSFYFSDCSLCCPGKRKAEIYKEGYMYHRHCLLTGRFGLSGGPRAGTFSFASSWHTRKVCSESFRGNSGIGCPWKVIRICAAGGRTMNLKGKKIGVALTGSFCTYKKVFQELEKLAEEGAQIQTIFSDAAQSIDSRFGKAEDFVKEAERITGIKPMLTISEAEPIGPGSLLDLLILLPCTGNTIAKLANGITDTPALMAAKAHLRNEKPLLLSISTNDALGMNMKNIGLLLNAKHIYFIPFGQDNPQKKPNSMIAHTELLIPAAQAALEGKQYQPLIMGG